MKPYGAERIPLLSRAEPTVAFERLALEGQEKELLSMTGPVRSGLPPRAWFTVVAV